MKKIYAIGMIAVAGMLFSFTQRDSKYFEISKNIEIFTNVYKELNSWYVDDLDPATVMSVGINAMVASLDPFTNYFSESQIEGYRRVMKQMKGVPHVTGIAPFIINPMMITHKDHTATGVLLKGVDPKLMPTVLDLPRHIIEPDPKKVSVESVMSQLRLPNSKPPERKRYRRRKKTKPTKKKSLLDQIKDLDRDGGSAAKKKPIVAPSAPPDEDDEEEDVPDDPNDGYDDDDDDDDDEAADAGTPTPAFDGGLTPDGGYTSVLPDDDDLPRTSTPTPAGMPRR